LVATLVTQDTKSPVPQEVICEIAALMKDGISLEDIVSRLRSRTVPNGYPVHPWREGVFKGIIIYICTLIISPPPGVNEGLSDQLRSILAQFEFSKAVKSWDERGFYLPLCSRATSHTQHYLS